MKLVPFKSEHIQVIDTQDAQLADDAYTDWNSKEYSDWLAKSGIAITGLVDDEVVFCAGKVEMWPGRHLLWASLSKKAAQHMVSITKAARRGLECAAGGRLEAIVRADFKGGGRWLEMLGFKYHHYEEKFLPDGSDAKIYVRFS